MTVELLWSTKAVLLLAGLMFLWALLLGIWKFRGMTTSEDHLAHPYVDIAHRAALLYSFALLLVATFVQLSGWSAVVNMVAAGALAFFFFFAVATYALHGWRRDTDNQFRDPGPEAVPVTVALIVCEVGGWLVLLGGFLDAQIL